MAVSNGLLYRVMTLAERLTQVMEMRGLNPSSWAAKANLPRATVRLAIKTGRESMELKTLVALAEAANVSLAWLATGSGSPQGVSLNVPHDTKYPTRALAVAAGHLVGCSERAIQAVLSVDDVELDPGALYWLALLQAKQLEYPDPPVRAKRANEKSGQRDRSANR